MSTKILSEFIEKLSKYCNGCNFTLLKYKSDTRKSQNLLEVSNHKSSVVFYVKVRSEAPGFWGITENRINELNSKNNEWYVILIVGDTEKFYLLTVSANIKP